MQRTRSFKTRRWRRGLALVALLASSAGLTACGAAADAASLDGGRGVPAGPASNFKIAVTNLPPASVGVPYEAPPLVASGATGPVQWRMGGGALPPGIMLSVNGRLAGVPETAGFFEFTAQATDGTHAALRTFAIAVDVIGLTAADGLQFGDAWSARPVTLLCAGASGPVQMEIVVNQSGGSFQSVDAATGTSVYVPGGVAGERVTDVLRATEEGSTRSAEISLNVVPDPTDGHEARFGSTDVWFIDFDCKHGTHAHATDWFAALAALGLRAPDSTGPLGTEADRLADLATRVLVLRHLNTLYLREPDGSPGASGLAISFPLTSPGASHTMPAPGSASSASSDQFSVMTVCDIEGSTAVGTAFLDAPGNPLQENNSPGGELGHLGVFVNNIAYMAGVGYRRHGDELVRDPVGAEDLTALKALLHGLPDPGGRYEVILYAANALARSLAYVAAHEIGHSLGLAHNPVITSGAVMNFTAAFNGTLDYRFLPENLTILRQGLPGPGRTGGSRRRSGPSAPTPATLPEGGVCVCQAHGSSR